MDIFAIRDRKTAYICFIKEADNVECFKRWFATAFLRADTMFALYPDDYDVYKLCDYDPSSMVVSCLKGPKLYGSVSDIFDQFHLTRPDSARSSDEA